MNPGIFTAMIPQVLKYGTCDSGMGASTTVIVSADFIGFGDDYFNNKYYMTIIKNAIKIILRCFIFILTFRKSNDSIN